MPKSPLLEINYFIFSKTIENLTSSTDFGDYIKLLKVCVWVARNQVLEMKASFKQLFFAYFTFVNRPNAFDNADQLNEADRLHTKLLDLYPILSDYRSPEMRDKAR